MNWKEFYDHEATRLMEMYLKVPVPEGAVLYFKDEDSEQGKVIGPITLELKPDAMTAESEIPDAPPKFRPYDPKRAAAKHNGGVVDDAVEFGWNYEGVAKVIAKRLAVELVRS